VIATLLLQLILKLHYIKITTHFLKKLTTGNVFIVSVIV